jgi:hypothetical protein
MTVPAFGQLLMQFEQLDNSKEQLHLQAQEQASRNIAQAVSTMAQIPQEARAGYLQTLQQSTGLNTGFLQSLADSTPTPASILLNRALQDGIATGQVSQQQLTAKVFGMNTVDYERDQQLSQYMSTGKLPKFLQGITDPKIRDAALLNFVAQSAGNPNYAAVENIADPLLTRPQEKQGAAVQAGLNPQANTVLDAQTRLQMNAAQVSAQYAEMNMRQQLAYSQLGENSHQFDSELAFKAGATLANIGGRLGVAEIRAGAKGRARNPLYAGIPDDKLAEMYAQQLKNNSTIQNTAPFFGTSDAGVANRAGQHGSAAITQAIANEIEARSGFNPSDPSAMTNPMNPMGTAFVPGMGTTPVDTRNYPSLFGNMQQQFSPFTTVTPAQLMPPNYQRP